MKYSLALIMLVAVSLSGSNRLVCQIFNSSEKLLQQYCDGFDGIPPANCSSDIDLMIDPSQVTQLKIAGCDPETVLDSTKRYQRNLRVLDILYSGYEDLDWFNLKLNQLQISNASHDDIRYAFHFCFPYTRNC